MDDPVNTLSVNRQLQLAPEKTRPLHEPRLAQFAEILACLLKIKNQLHDYMTIEPAG